MKEMTEEQQILPRNESRDEVTEILIHIKRYEIIKK
jgi:hypothetical protein